MHPVVALVVAGFVTNPVPLCEARATFNQFSTQVNSALHAFWSSFLLTQGAANSNGGFLCLVGFAVPAEQPPGSCATQKPAEWIQAILVDLQLLLQLLALCYLQLVTYIDQHTGLPGVVIGL